MGTEVLRPQDILGGERFRVSPAPFPRRKSYFQNGNGNNYNYGYQKKKINNQFRHHQPEVINSERLPNKSDSHNRNSNGNGNGNGLAVTILRRGESLDSLNSKIKRDNNNNNNNNSSSSRTTSFTKKERNVYAGSVCSVSPSPSSLPLPTFFQKQEASVKSFDDSATRDLRRLLRLE